MQSLGEIELRVPAVGEKMWYLFFFLFVKLRVLRVFHSSGIYFEQALCGSLWVDFDSIFTIFTARRSCITHTCYGDVAGWLAVRHTPVLYQNG